MARLDAEFAITNTTINSMAAMTTYNVNVVVPVPTFQPETKADPRPRQVPDLHYPGCHRRQDLDRKNHG